MKKNIKKIFQPSQAIGKLRRIQSELQDTIEQLEYFNKSSQGVRINCENCGVLNVRMRMDNSYYCRSCGHDSRIRIKIEKGSAE